MVGTAAKALLVRGVRRVEAVASRQVAAAQAEQAVSARTVAQAEVARAV
jgi:hypothetical protein